MSDENRPEKYPPAFTNMLQNRPERRAKRISAILLLLLGGGLLLGVVAFGVWQALSQPAASTGTNAATTSASSTKGSGSGASMPPGWYDPAIYWQPIREQVAQGLHLSVAQVTTKLVAAGATSTATPSSNKNSAAPDPGASMTAVAVQQSLTTDQLRTLELNALQKGCDAMVAQGRLTQDQASQRMQFISDWDQGTMNWYVTHAFFV